MLRSSGLLVLCTGAAHAHTLSEVTVEESGAQQAAVRFNVSWSPGQLQRGRVSLIVSRDLTSEPRLSVSSTFSNVAQVFSFPVDATRGTAAFPSPPGTADFYGYPFDTLDDFPEGKVNVQAVLTPYELYNRSDGHSLWLPSFNSFEYSEDYDSYGWADVTTVFGGAKGLSAPHALYSKPSLQHWSPKGGSLVQLELSEAVPEFPAPLPETEFSKYVSITSPRLSKFWGRPVNVSAWVTLPAGFDAHPEARYPLIINHGNPWPWP